MTEDAGRLRVASALEATGAYDGPVDLDLGNLAASDPAPVDPDVFGRTPSDSATAAAISSGRSNAGGAGWRGCCCDYGGIGTGGAEGEEGRESPRDLCTRRRLDLISLPVWRKSYIVGSLGVTRSEYRPL